MSSSEHLDIINVPMPHGDGYVVPMASFKALSILSVLSVMESLEDPVRGVRALTEVVKAALLNPDDWDQRISHLNVDEFMELVHGWTSASEAAA